MEVDGQDRRFASIIFRLALKPLERVFALLEFVCKFGETNLTLRWRLAPLIPRFDNSISDLAKWLR